MRISWKAFSFIALIVVAVGGFAVFGFGGSDSSALAGQTHTDSIQATGFSGSDIAIVALIIAGFGALLLRPRRRRTVVHVRNED